MMRRTPALAVLLALVALSAGCQQQTNRDLAEGIRQGDANYRQGNYVGAERDLSRAIQADRSAPEAAEAYYIRGLTRLKQSKIPAAEEDFICAIQLGNRNDIKANCQVCLGSIAFERENYVSAYKYYAAAAENLPQISPNDWVLYRLSVSAQKIGQWDSGRQYLAKLIREYPEGEAARLARKRLHYSCFTIQAGSFRQPAGARALMVQLQRQFLPVRAEAQQVGSDVHQVVYVGRFRDFKSAREMLDKVRKTVPDALILP
jgi:tetratricopeptide (TPR) repeat protein